MAKNERRGHARSIMARQKLLLFLLIPITLLDLVVSAYALIAVQREISSYAEAMTGLQLRQLKDTFSSVNTSMQRILTEDDALLVKAQSDDAVERISAQNSLIKKCVYPASELSGKYSFFFYFEDTKTFLSAMHSTAIPMAKRGAVRDALIEHLGQMGEPSSITLDWEMVAVEDTYYAIKMFLYRGVWIGGCVPAEMLMAPLESAFPGQDSFPVLLTDDGVVATNYGRIAQEGLTVGDIRGAKSTFTHGWRRWLVVESTDSGTGFYIKHFIKGYGQFESLVLLQAVVLLLLVLVLCVVSLAMVYMQRRVLRPLRQFTDGLKKNDPDAPLLQLTGNEIAELEEANEQFRNLMREIKRLKIDAYENELARQKMQMDYMQLQIKPHFFLNCLNLIHTMSQNGQTADISRLSETTANYLRYIFQSDMERMPLAQELSHVRHYLEIMAIRYPGAFSYDIVADEEVTREAIPPLILQTFVENAIKYGIVPGQKLEISMSVLPETQMDKGVEKPYLVIFIIDNGRGFAPEDLELWRGGGELPRVDGRHIGIANAAKRLRYAYGGAAALSLYNSPQGGAVAELHLPAEAVEGEGEST